MSEHDNVLAMNENLDAAIANITKVIKENTPAWGEAISGSIDINITRLEKLIIIRAALASINAPPKAEVLETGEALDLGALDLERDLRTDPSGDDA